MASPVSKSSHQEVWREITLHRDVNTYHRTSSKLSQHIRVLALRFARKHIYLWFLFLSVLEIISPERDYRILVPFLVLLLLTTVKAILGRKRVPETGVNQKTHLVWDHGEVFSVKTKDLKAGHFICLKNDDEVPADIILLASGRSDNCCLVDVFPFVGTARIQSKSVVRETQRIIKSTTLEEALDRLSRLRGTVKLVQPNVRLDVFKGLMKLKGHPVASRLTLDHLLLKQSKVITTPWVLGLVVYAGDTCKSELIAKSARMEKQAEIDSVLMKFELVVISIAIVLALLGTVLETQMSHDEPIFLSQFRVFLLLFGQAVPASVYLLLALVRMTQSYLLSADLSTGLMNIGVRSSHAMETLSHIDYVFLDKTGTITSNRLNAKVVMVNGSDFARCDLPEPLHQSVCVDRSGKGVSEAVVVPHAKHRMSIPLDNTEPSDWHEGLCGFKDLSSLMGVSGSNYHRFCECLVMCSSLTKSMSGEVTCSSKYDEALYRMAKDLWVVIKEKTDCCCSFQIGNLDASYQILAVMDYKPQIQRMRVLAQKNGSEEGMLLIKGTVDIVTEHFAWSNEEMLKLEKYCDALATRQYKIIVYGFKAISPEDMLDVSLKIEASYTSATRHRDMETLFHALEKDCSFSGVVGLEDAIRPGVSTAIYELSQANTKTWMLSGDSETTTLATATAVGLLPDSVSVLKLRGLALESDCKIQLLQKVRSNILRELGSVVVSRQNSMLSDDRFPQDLNLSIREQTPKCTPPSHILQRFAGFNHRRLGAVDLGTPLRNSEFSIVMDGISFSTALREPETRELLATLLYCAQSVCCFSMLPHQKALLVRLVRENMTTHPVVLAIGDGENDIAMLQIAHVGIAVQTGNNAKVVNSSDLKVDTPAILPALLKSGHLVQRRIFEAVSSWVYVVTVPAGLGFCYTFLCDFTGTDIVRPALWVLYAIEGACFLLLQSIFGYDLPNGGLHDMADIYQKKKSVWKSLVKEALIACLHSGVIFLFLSLSSYGIIDGETGSTDAFDGLGASVFLSVSIIMMLHFLVKAPQLPAILPFTAVGFILLSVFGDFWVHYKSADDSAFYQIFTSPTRVFAEFGSVLTCTGLTYVCKTYWKLLNPRQMTESNSLFNSFEPSNRSKLPNLKHLSKLYKDSQYWLKHQENSGHEMHPVWLYFHSQEIEEEFHKVSVRFTKRTQQALLFGGFLLLYLVYQSTVIEFSLARVLLYTFSAGYILVMARFLISGYLMYASLGIIIAGKFATELTQQEIDAVSFIFPALFSLVFIPPWKQHAAIVLWNLLTVILDVSMFDLGGEVTEQSLHRATLIAVTSLYSTGLIVYTYLNERMRRKEFRVLKLTENNVERSKEILSYLFPDFVKDKVVKGDLPIVLAEAHVTVIFIDICDFDTICSLHSSTGLTSLLDDLFKKLDYMCDAHGLSKVETVGKTYMACAGLIEQETVLEQELARISHARRAINMALEVMHTFQFISLRHGPLQANIGISSGPIIAGVVGFHKPQFALIGDTVNTASRMSSTAPYPCSIQISQCTYDMLGCSVSELKLEPRTVQVKGKGDMQTYLVKEAEERIIDGRKGSNYLISPSSNFLYLNPNQKKMSLMTTLGFWTFSDLFMRKDTEAVQGVKWFSGFGPETPKQRFFQQEVMQRHYHLVAIGLGLLVSAYILQTVMWAVELAVDVDAGAPWALALTMFVCMVLGVLVKRMLLKLSFQWLFATGSIVLCAAGVLGIDLDNKAHASIALCILAFFLVFFLCFGALFFRHALILLVSLVIYWACSIAKVSDWQQRIGLGLSLLPIATVCLSYVYSREWHLRVYTNLEHAAEKEISRTERVLVQMMPVHVYESLLQEERITDELKGVTLLYADIVGFTALSSRKSPTEMVHLLSQLFTRFDRLCVKNHVYKVHTIGDCYVAMGYTGAKLGRDVEEECLNIASQACDMAAALRDINAETPDLGLEMRIGVHTGTEVITAGITGAKIVRYDIYGPDVLIANKMESKGVAGQIHVSEITKILLERLVPDIYRFELKGPVEVPSINRTVLGYLMTQVSE